jgi:hypothetical protein
MSDEHTASPWVIVSVKLKQGWDQQEDRKDIFFKCTKDENGCKLWLAAKRPDGYGIVIFEGKRQLAHRVSFYLTYGYWPPDVTRHLCHNPRCVNPHHLSAGTQSDNIRDKIIRNRQAKGESTGRAKVTSLDVQSKIIPMIVQKIPFVEIAKQVGCSKYTVQLIASGKTWRHLSRLPGMKVMTEEEIAEDRRKFAEWAKRRRSSKIT